MADLEDLVVRLTADTSKFQSQIAGAATSLQGFQKAAGNALGAIGTGLAGLATAYVTGRLFESLNDTVEHLDQVGKAAQRLGISTESYSKLAFAFQVVGGNAEDAERSIRFFDRALIQASQDSTSQAGKAFAQLNVNVKELISLPADQQILKMADAFNKIQNPAQKAALETATYGRGVAALLDLFAKGSIGIKAFYAEASKLGVVFSQAQTDQAENYKEAIMKLDAAWEGLKVTLIDTAAFDAVIKGIQNLTANVITLKEAWGKPDFRQIGAGAGGFANVGSFASSRGIVLNGDSGGVPGTGGLNGVSAQGGDIKIAMDKIDAQKNLNDHLNAMDQARNDHDLAMDNETNAQYLQNKLNLQMSLDAIDINAQEQKMQAAAGDQIEYQKQADELVKVKAKGAEEELKIRQQLEEENTKYIRQAAEAINTSFESNFADFLSGTKKAKDAFKDFASSIISELAKIQAHNLAQEIFGGAAGASGTGGGLGALLSSGGSSLFKSIGSLLPSFADGGFTGTGSSGGVDGKGGFPAILHPNEMVLNSRQMGSMGGGSTTVISPITIQATNAADIDRRLMAALPLIVDASVQRVSKLMDSGGTISQQIGKRL